MAAGKSDLFNKLFGNKKESNSAPFNKAPAPTVRPSRPAFSPAPQTPAYPDNLPGPGGTDTRRTPAPLIRSTGGGPGQSSRPGSADPLSSIRPSPMVSKEAVVSNVSQPLKTGTDTFKSPGQSVLPGKRSMPQKSFSQNEPDYSGEPEAKEKLSDTDTELEYTMDDLFHLVVEESGSDLHLSINAPPVIRVHGQMIKTKLPNINKDQMRHLLMGLLNNDQRDKLDEIWEIDFSLSVPGLCRFRCNVFHQKDGLSGVFRVIPQKIPTLRQLNMPAIIGDLAKKHKGLVLVTGPTGNGKSTTLAAMVDMINSERHEHIITIEDPIEFAHVHKKCIINQREVGQDTKSFSMALRSALREDPDIILVGELRDLETIQMALTAAETGHLVFGTLHTSSAYKTIDRIIDVFPPHQQEQIRVQLGETLQAVVAQQLIPLADGSGRICAQEILINSPAIGNLIREGKTYQIFSVLQTSKQQGMQTMDQALKTLLKHKKITYEEAFKRATDKKSFEKY